MVELSTFYTICNLTWIQYEISGLELTYIVLYSCFDTTRTWHTIFRATIFFFYNMWTWHEPTMKLID